LRTTPSDKSPQTRRIILLRGKNPQVLLGFDGPHRTLPAVQVPGGERVAERLTERLRTTCSIDAVSITCIEVPHSGASSEATVYEIMEPCEPAADAPLGKYWVSVSGLTESAFCDPNDFEALRQAVAQAIEDIESAPRAPFGRLGWFEEVEDWVQEQIAPHRLDLTGRFRQLNASPTFSLIRFETDGPAVWFKAVGAPNDHEYPITLALTHLVPRFVPTVLATRPDWNAWLSFEAEGPLLLGETCGLAAWKAAARDLAELQMHSIGRSLHLLDVGARDLRTQTLSARVEPFFQFIAHLMERQTKTTPLALTREALTYLSERVRDGLTLLDETNFPSCLEHLDLNPGNIIAPLTGCVFLDWAEASVGHPFLSFEYLREHFRRTCGSDGAQENELVSCYSFAWRRFASEREIHQALEVSPLVAVFAYAAGSDLWSDPQRREQSHAAAFLRSLARRMDREARAFAERNVSCPS
jgi:hypothetical protein